MLLRGPEGPMTVGFVAEFARIRTINVASLNSGEFSYVDGLGFRLFQIRYGVPPGRGRFS